MCSLGHHPSLIFLPTPVPEQTVIPSLSDVLSRLSIVSNNLEESKQNHDKQLTQTLKDIENLKSNRETTEKELERTSRRYNYFQELKSYVNDLADFLDAKVRPSVCKLEEMNVHALLTCCICVSSLSLKRWRASSMD
jgi:DNA repair exonuclease SbcCD ATPase subunit